MRVAKVRARCVAAACAWLLLAAPLAAQERARSANLGALLSGRKAPEDPALSEIALRIDELSHGTDAAEVAELVARARAALGEARTATAAGDPKAAGRARELAWAALTLASRRVALRQAQRHRQLAERRAERAEQALAAERAALEAARASSVEGAR